MSDTTYIDFVQPAVNAEWLNEVNNHVWHDTPVNGATVHMASTIAVTPFDDIAATDVQAALNEINDKITTSDPIDASEVSYTPAGTGAVTTTVQSKLRETISVKDFGADPTGATNSAAAFNAAILKCALAGGGVVAAPYGNYKILDTVYIPAYVTLDLGGSVIEGPGVGSATNLFESAYLNNGAVVSNIGVALKYVIRGSIRNGFIKNCGKAIAVERLIDGCEIRDLQFENCTYAVWSNDSYYPRFINLFSRGSAGGATNAAFYFATYVNVNAIESVFVTDRVLGMEIAVNGNGVTLYNCAAEGCTDGIKVTGNLSPIKLDTCYFENITAVALSFNGAGTVATVDNCFFNTSATGIYVGSHVDVDVKKNNTFISTTYPVTCANDQLAYGKVSVKTAAIADNGYPVNPAGMTIGKKVDLDYDNIIYNGATGDTLIKTKVHSNTLIAFEHEGDSGPWPHTGVAFCQKTVPVGNPVSITVDTRIAYRTLSGIVVFRLFANDDMNGYQLYGFVFGDQVKQLDSSGKTVAVSDNGGYLRLTISSFVNTLKLANVVGIVRHV